MNYDRVDPPARMVDLGIAVATAITAVCTLPDYDVRTQVLQTLTTTMNLLNNPLCCVREP